LDIDLLVRETFVAQVQHYATLGSTNDRARQCAAEGVASLPLLIVADEQTAGRGRGTNRWWTGRGSLACSLLLDSDDPGIDLCRSPLVALGAGVAVAKAAQPLLPCHTVGVHWPNDVVVDGRKLAGVLVEALSDRRLVVGIGMNLNNSLRDAPKELQASAATLWELTGVRHRRTQILLALLRHLGEGLALLASAPQQIAAEANRLCLQHGQPLTVRLGRRVVSGRCEGIASDGALLLDTPRGRERLYSGVLR
jgi:BirA family biotin operon repressor/biotin-[acetyl-CoA-carboxylase] ligase